jgi:hypothetical protein
MEASRIYVICSPQPRVGKTLLARLLCEYVHTEGHAVAAFDVNPDNPELVNCLPDLTDAASIDDTLGQVALFDRLVIPDATARVVDLGHRAYDQFFAIAQAIDLFGEAHRRGIAALAFFLGDDTPASRRAFAALAEQVPAAPVHNEALMPPRVFRDAYPTPGVPLRMPALAPELRPLLAASADTVPQLSSAAAAQLDSWRRRAFIAIREFELSLLLDNLRHAM